MALIFLFVYFSVFSFILGFVPVKWEDRPSLYDFDASLEEEKRTKKFLILSYIAMINKPICVGALRKRIAKDLTTGHVNMSPEEFLLFKELAVIFCLFVSFPQVSPDFMFFWVAMGFAAGYMLPEFWLKGKIKRVKNSIIRDLPDAIDLLALCVNAGLDFMLALKWVVDKSPKSVIINDFNTLLKAINVGKTRRQAIKDLSARYEIADLSTFARTLIQADKMGTSITDALNILSEDMRLSRYRTAEQMALKAPLKMLVPLLFFIFPVVGILVAGPILVDFLQNSPIEAAQKLTQ